MLRYEDGIPIFDKLDEVQREQIEARKRDENYKDRQMALNCRMVLLTGLLVVCTLFTGGISAYQAYVAKLNADAAIANAAAARDQVAAAKDQVAILLKQIDEMQKSGVDAHESAVQARTQAARLRDLADQALAQANAASALVDEAHRSNQRSADLTGALVSETRRAADIAERARSQHSCELLNEQLRASGLSGLSCSNW